MDKKYIIALEFSGSQVKGAAAEVAASPIGSLQIPKIQAIASEEQTNCVQYGRVQNIIEASKAADVVLQKLENSPALREGRITSVFIGLAGRSLGSVSATAEIQLPSEMAIDSDILEKLHKEATKGIPGDKMILKVIPRKYYVNNQGCQKVIGMLGSSLRGEFTILTCNAANKNNIDRVMSQERLNMNVQDYVVTPLAIADMVLGDEEKQLGCVLVDMGAQTTTVSIYKNRALQYLATLPLGSYHITLDLAKALNLTFERAEQIKINQGDAIATPTATSSDSDARLASYLQARLGEIVANIMAQISYAGYKGEELSKGVVITGRGAKLTNLSQFMERALKLPVRKASIPHTVSCSGYESVANDFASLISIVDYAAALPSFQSCMSFPEVAPVVEETQKPIENIQIGTQIVTAPYEEPQDEPDTEDWLLDDDEIERTRIANRKKEEKRQAKEAKQAESQRAKAEAKAKREEEERNKQQKSAQKSASWLDKFKSKVADIMAYDPTDGDEDLDEMSNLK